MTVNRRRCRAGDPCRPRTLQEAIYCLVHHSAADAKTIAERAGVRYGYLLDAANPDRDEIQFQSRLIYPCSEAGANDVVIEFLCRQRDGVFVPIPSLMLDGAQSLALAQLDVVRELGEDAAKLQDILRNHHIDAQEADEFDAEVDQTIQKLAQWKRAVRSLVGKEIR